MSPEKRDENSSTRKKGEIFPIAEPIVTSENMEVFRAVVKDLTQWYGLFFEINDLLDDHRFLSYGEKMRELGRFEGSVIEVKKESVNGYGEIYEKLDKSLSKASQKTADERNLGVGKSTSGIVKEYLGYLGSI